MKKILFIIEDFRFGGVEVSLINLLNHIDYDKKDYQVSVITYGTEYDMLSKLHANNRVKLIRMDQRWLHVLENVLATIVGTQKAATMKNKVTRYLVVQTAKRGKYDVIIRYHHAAVKTLFNRLKKRTGQKFISYYHRSIPSEEYLCERYTRNCDTVVVCNDGCRQNVVNAFPYLEKKLFSLENLVPYTEIQAKAISDTVLFDKKYFNIVTCARIDSEKGIDTAIEACRILAQKDLCIRWYVIGSVTPERPEYGDYIRGLIRKYDLAETFILLGGKSNPYPYFTQCDLYVQPSKEEACPLTITEVQVCGSPIVATDTIGARALIQKDQTGCITENSAEALAEKMYELYCDREKLERIKSNVRKLNFAEYNRNILDRFYRLIEN